MLKIGIKEFEEKVRDILCSAGMNTDHAAITADVFRRATLRAVGHHDIDMLLGRIKAIKEGKFNPNAAIKKISGFGAVESYDGDNGLGEVCTHYVTQQSMALAEQHGIGYCTIRNSNHFLSAAPYVEMADEKGFFTVVLSKSIAGMSLPGADKAVMGNSPFGFAANYVDGTMLFDICLSYTSVGKIKDRIKNNQKVPAYWGRDKDGEPTEDPSKMFESGLYDAIGDHKGFGIALLVEILTSIIGNGTILDEDEKQSGIKGQYAQAAISIKIDKIMPREDFVKRNQKMIQRLKEKFPPIYIPGERSVEERAKITKRGYFELDDDVFQRIESIL